MSFLTVITPTYNRGNKLSALYRSLVSQTDQGFDWLIVDDGSSDETSDIVKKWEEEKKISIRYIKKDNGGKHTALNVGIASIDSPWTFIVDSDDYLTEDAVETIRKKAETDDGHDICGLAFLRKSSTGSFLTSKQVPKDGYKSDFINCRYGLEIRGDMAEVWKTSCLKEYPFPEYDNETFCSEDVVWIELAGKYKMRFYNIPIYICDYLEDGLTRSRRLQNLNSPKGVMHRGEVQLQAGLPFKFKCRAMLYFLVYGRVAGYSYSELFERSEHRALFILLFLPSLVARRKLT
ncbi:MAG: glycosyltransferase family 2 protein [Butyrivibrio sp.]|nr:glycosyltransferase family 2 protein [Butyrivibrio sp.]